MRVKAYSEDDVNFDKTIDTKAVKMAFQRRLADYFDQSLLLNRENYERYKKKRNILRGLESRCR